MLSTWSGKARSNPPQRPHASPLPSFPAQYSPALPHSRSGIQQESRNQSQEHPPQMHLQHRATAWTHQGGVGHAGTDSFSSPHSPRLSQLRLLRFVSSRGFGHLGSVCLDWRRKKSYLQPAWCPSTQRAKALGPRMGWATPNSLPPSVVISAAVLEKDRKKKEN